MPGEVCGGTAKAYLPHDRPQPLPRGKEAGGAAGCARAAPCPTRSLAPRRWWSGRLELDAVFEALQALPETDRAALLMHAQDGLPYAAIASALGLSIAAVKVRVHRRGSS